MIDPRRHPEHRGGIGALLRSIPGFRGYLEKDYRQESDHLLRQWIAERLQQSKRPLDQAMVALIESGRMDRLNTWERVKRQLDALALRFRSVVRGYSGFFDYVRVDENLLNQIYEHDATLVQSVDKLAAAIEQTAGGADVPEATVRQWLRQIEDLDHGLTQRSQMLKGISSR